VDAKLRRTLEAVARDRRSGAAELALRATDALLAWTRRRPRPTEAELLDAARALLRAQPAMAPLLRLANEVAFAIGARDPQAAMRRRLGRFRAILRQGPRRIAQHLRARLSRLDDPIVVTYSFSSTVVASLQAARKSLRGVWCSESRPGVEGRRTARVLAEAGIDVTYLTDAALADTSPAGDVLVVGADIVFSDGFRNKIGTQSLAGHFLRAGLPVWVVADTTKFWPERHDRIEPRRTVGPRLLSLPFSSGPELWPRAPGNVWAWNPLFWPVRWHPGIVVLTEKGWLTPRQVRRAMARILISPRLGELAR
jgi:translation initiation factor 2B subunit (eIF-2B alpha/beta/delta family)